MMTATLCSALVQVLGLSAGSSYTLKVVAELTNCLKGGDKDDCQASSQPYQHSPACEHQCADGHCLERPDVGCDQVCTVLYCSVLYYNCI